MARGLNHEDITARSEHMWWNMGAIMEVIFDLIIINRSAD